MVSNTPFGMYSYGTYGLNNSYNPQFTGAHSQPAHESGSEKGGESEKESGSKAFIINSGRGKSTESSNSDLALSVGIGACVAALGVIFTRHLLKPSDISKFLGKSKNLTGKVTEEVKTIVPEIEKTIPKVEEIAKEAVEKTVPKIEETVKDIVEKTVPKVETGTLKTGEELIEKKVISPEKEIVSSKFPKTKTLQETFKNAYEKGESVLNKVPYAGDVKKETTKINKQTPPSQKSFLTRIKDRVVNFFSNKKNKVKNSTNFSKDNDVILMSKKAGISEIKNVKSSHPTVEEIFKQKEISSSSKFTDYDKALNELADKNLKTKTLNNLGSSFKINNGIEEIIAEKAPNHIEYLNQLRNNQQPIEEINKFIIELEKGKWENFPKDPDYKSYYLEAIKNLRK